MRFTSLATVACLSAYSSGAVIPRRAAGPPSRKRQGLLDNLGLLNTGTTRIPVYLPTATSIAIPTPLVSYDSATITKSLTELGDPLFPNDPTASGSSVSSTIPSTSTPSPPPARTSSSSTKPVVVLSTPPGTPTPSSAAYPTVSEIASWTSTATPSSTLTAVLTSATSTNSTWKTVGISVSVVTLIGLTILVVVFYEQWTAFVRDVFSCRHSQRNQDPLGDEDFSPDKHYEDYDATARSHNRKWAREIRESARLSNIRYPTDVFYGDGSVLGPGKAGIGAGGCAGRKGGIGEFGQLDPPSRPSFLQRLSMISFRSSSPVSQRLRMKSHSPGIGKAGDGFVTSTSSQPIMATI